MVNQGTVNNYVPLRVDDHPRAMVLPFDQKALEEAHPRKYQSGYEIFKIPMQSARLLFGEDFLGKINAATGLTLADKSFTPVTGEVLAKLKEYADKRLAERMMDKNVHAFYHYLVYFAKYAMENNTGVIFDL
jgi:hypothetical protein